MVNECLMERFCTRATLAAAADCLPVQFILTNLNYLERFTVLNSGDASCKNNKSVLQTMMRTDGKRVE
jgi:hypothetical protein